ncbi:hypothetical protein EVB91_198 [Rhizobium phage RHph_I1_18]|nr:hypothetical protein EVB91_198 [Rhizobium phage RHph_I1_18]
MTSAFNRATIRELEAAFNEAHAKIAEQFGITIDNVSIRFNSEMFRISKLEGRVKKLESLDTVPAVVALPQTSGYLPVGTMFQVKRTVYKIIKVSPHKPKNCYTVETHNGARWVCGKDMVASGTIMKRGDAV